MNLIRSKEPEENKTFLVRLKSRILHSVIGRLFLDQKFFYYTCIGIFFAVLNVFLLWLLIDVFSMPTVVASSLVIGFTFIFRYVLLHFFKVF